MTPFDDLAYLINHFILGDDPTIEDFILLLGTFVAFIAFVLWCCFPIQAKDAGTHRQPLDSQLQHKSSNYSRSTPISFGNGYT